jgi:two-component system sensor histidine kinase DegS
MAKEVLETLENERRYVARELHDGIAQTTLQLGLQAGICNKLLERGNLEMLANELAELEKRVLVASSQVREMIADMRPPQLEPEADLSDYIGAAIETHRERGGPLVTYDVEVSDRLKAFPTHQNLTLFRIVQEALLNVRKHAHAQNVRLTITTAGSNMQMTIVDDGQGFDMSKLPKTPGEKGGAGLANLQARAQSLGGSLTISSQVNGGGTEVLLSLPL